jgi:hypothetical protein
VNWIRRTRVDGDSWQSLEVPLGEDLERYHLRILNGLNVVREVETTNPTWSYSAGDIASDGVSGGLSVEVAQISERYGIGPYNRMMINV